ncbi:MAG: hypothetical protein IT353_05870 [Gemmatimonadaceae bacterium]|nr:hypothetical protein [Gemmatimonadaceae bacterium]
MSLHPHVLRVAALVVLLAPAAADAQRRTMGGSKEADWNAITEKSGPAGPTISGKDFEKLSPYKALLDKKKDLKLTDAQTASLTSANSAFLLANQERFKTLDSLKKAIKPGAAGDVAADEETRLVIARESFQTLIREIRASFDSVAKSIDGLDETQKQAAASVLSKNAEETTEMIREKSGARGAAAGARARPPRM